MESVTQPPEQLLAERPDLVRADRHLHPTAGAQPRPRTGRAAHQDDVGRFPSRCPAGPRALGAWLEHPAEAGLIARRLALAMARVQLGDGRDVVVPQFLGRLEFVLALQERSGRVAALPVM